jgi:hypothetical protein
MTLYCFYNKRTRRVAGVPVRNIESTAELSEKINNFGLSGQFGIMTVTVKRKRARRLSFVIPPTFPLPPTIA